MRLSKSPDNTGIRIREPRVKFSRRKKICFSLILVFLASFLVVLIGEVTFRIRGAALTARIKAALGDSEHEKGWAIFDSDLHYRNRPNWKDHNAYGMRDHPVSNNERFRVLILGDSIGYDGESIEDTYPGQLEALLNNQSSLTECDVLNASVKGYTNYQELAYLRKYGLELEPDIVGVAFCVNDLHKFLHQFDVVDGQVVANTYAFSPNVGGSSVPRVIAPSIFLTWLWNKGKAAMTRIGLRRGMIFECRPDISPAWTDEAWNVTELQIEEMASICRENNVRLFLFAFPHAEQYREEYLKKDREYVLMPQRKLRNICDRFEIPYLDLYPSLDASGFIWDGIHLNAAGRSTSAQSIYEFLKTQRLIPQSETQGTHD